MLSFYAFNPKTRQAWRFNCSEAWYRKHDNGVAVSIGFRVPDELSEAALKRLRAVPVDYDKWNKSDMVTRPNVRSNSSHLNSALRNLAQAIGDVQDAEYALKAVDSPYWGQGFSYETIDHERAVARRVRSTELEKRQNVLARAEAAVLAAQGKE